MRLAVRRGGLLLAGALTAALLGCGDPPCDEVVAIGAQGAWAGLLKRDGSAWTWRPKGQASIALEHAGATGFSNAGLCLKLAAGDVTCDLRPDIHSIRLGLDSVVQEIALSNDVIPKMCGVLLDGTLACYLPNDDVGFTPIAQGIRHASVGDSVVCAVTETGKLAVPWSSSFSSSVDWTMAGASLTDVLEAVALTRAEGCVARTAAGQIWSIHIDWETDPPGIAEEQITGIDGPVSQLVSSLDPAGSFVCALVTDGTVSCWTEDGPRSEVRVPKKISGLPRPATALAAGVGYLCALLNDGTVWCGSIRPYWGARVGSCGS